MGLLLSQVTKAEFKEGERALNHALYVHCCCHVLQMSSVQAANATPDIKYVSSTLMMLWKLFH